MSAEATRRSYYKHRDKRKAESRAYYWANRDRQLAHSKAWRIANPDKVKQKNREMIPRKYGMTLADRDRMARNQHGECGICHDVDFSPWHIDRCHASGKVRALLCSNCNALLGRARDNPALLRAAAIYLEEHA